MNPTPLSDNITQLLSDTGAAIAQTKPHAFLNWVLFDNQFNYVAASSGFQQVGADQELHQHILTNLPITSKGYLYIYTSNETPNVDVFFDNLQVTHTRGPLLEEDQYYPFGLTMVGISDEATKSNYAKNKFEYGGKEIQNQEFSDGSGLEEYDFNARFSDVQIGRFTTIDPLLEKFSSTTPYNYCLRNPINFIDPDGIAATYNWATGQYEDHGKTVGWEEVQQHYEIGDNAKNTSVMLFPTFGKKDSPKDWGGAVETAFDAAKDLPNGNVKLLQVNDIEDAVSQIESINGFIDNIFIGSHGYGPDDPSAYAYFAIGRTRINSAKQINVTYSSEFSKVAAKLSTNAEIVLMACHAGAAHNHGIALKSALAKKLNAAVYGNQSWTAASSGMFNNGGWFSRRNYPTFDGVPAEHRGDNDFTHAISDEGKWTKASPNGTTTTVTKVYFDSFGKIHYE